MSTTFSKKSKNLFFSSDVTVFSLHEQHDASLNFWFRTHIILAKNVPWHILTPSAVACDMFLLRASAHHWHVSAFLCNRKFLGIPYYTKNRHTVSSVTASHLHEASGIRTPDNLIKSQVLYRLS